MHLHLQSLSLYVISACRDEANDDVKSNILVAMGSWLKAASSLPPVVSTRLADCLKEKDVLKSGALTATLQVGCFSSPLSNAHIAVCIDIAALFSGE